MITLEIILHDNTVFVHQVASWAAFQAQVQAGVSFVKLQKDNTELLLSIKSIKMIKKLAS